MRLARHWLSSRGGSRRHSVAAARLGACCSAPASAAEASAAQPAPAAPPEPGPSAPAGRGSRGTFFTSTAAELAASPGPGKPQAQQPAQAHARPSHSASASAGRSLADYHAVVRRVAQPRVERVELVSGAVDHAAPALLQHQERPASRAGGGGSRGGGWPARTAAQHLTSQGWLGRCPPAWISAAAAALSERPLITWAASWRALRPALLLHRQQQRPGPWPSCGSPA